MDPRPHSVGPAPNHQHTHTIILLHGRDSVADEFAAELFESEASVPANRPRTLIDLFPTVRWVFPSAPLLPSARFGISLSQWFDIWSVEEPGERSELQQPGLRMSVEAVLRIVAEEEAVVERSNIFLGGISQGFTMAVASFFAAGNGLAGLIGMSSWMPGIDLLAANTPEHSPRALCSELADQVDKAEIGAQILRRTPVFLTHSADDDVVPLRNGIALRDALRARGGLDVEWHEYSDGGHWVNEPNGVDDLVAFLRTTGVSYHGQLS
ncbi:hypothetical protein ACHAQH_005155 [Verticillium albo-atrum]